MEVLYETTSLRSAIKAERELIAFAHGANMRCEVANTAPGGEGLRAGAARYWLYILVEGRR